MLKPTVSLCSVPVLHSFGNVDYVARIEGNGGLASFLIPTPARYADEYLTGTVVDVPVVAASRLERYVGHGEHGFLPFI